MRKFFNKRENIISKTKLKFVKNGVCIIKMILRKFFKKGIVKPRWEFNVIRNETNLLRKKQECRKQLEYY